MPKNKNFKSGYTLIEIMVVITILLLMATLSIVVFGSNSSAKIREAARISQSAFLRGQAFAASQQARAGVRLIRDQTDPTLIVGFAFVQQMPNLVYPPGSFRFERQSNDGVNALSPDVLFIRGFDGAEAAYKPGTPTVDWAASYNQGPELSFLINPGWARVPAFTGAWYQIQISQKPGYVLGKGNEVLEFASPYPFFLIPYRTAAPTGDATAIPASVLDYTSCELQMGNSVIPFQEMVMLPTGVVIDLNQSSPSISLAAANGSIDVLFRLNNEVCGALSVGKFYFVIRSLGDVVKKLDPSDPAVRGDILIMSITPQTGMVLTSIADLTDKVSNTTGLPPGDGKADDLFNFARNGKGAGH